MTGERAKLDVERVIGANLRRLRDEKPWTQRRVAEESGLSRTEVERIEHGEVTPGADVVLKLAGALQVDPGEFFRGGTWVPSKNDFSYEEIEER